VHPLSSTDIKHVFVGEEITAAGATLGLLPCAVPLMPLDHAVAEGQDLGVSPRALAGFLTVSDA
jgi:hypothetical protein